jgi:hypothetical protein
MTFLLIRGSMLTFLPRTQTVFPIVAGALLVFDCFEMAIDRSLPNVLAGWISFSEPAFRIMSGLVPALTQVADDMRSTGYTNRIPIVQNVILWHFIFYALFSIVILAYLVVEKKKNGSEVEKSVENWIDSTGKSSETLLLKFVLASILFFIFIFTKFGYNAPRQLYSSDFDFFLISLFFYVSTMTNTMTIALLFYGL